MSRGRLGMVLAAVGLLAMAGLVAVAVVGSATRAPADAAERVERLAAGMRCPDCQALSVAESRTAAAAAIRDELGAQVAAGRSDAEIRAHFVERYGQWILLAPEDPIAWWLPVLLLAAGLAGFGLWLRAGHASRRPVDPEVAAADERRGRIRDELEALDG
jgi:cytochrome c-type biogenesis protein CcmH